jgi:D-glycero-alpha-D-manno-heptose 1-phosphate guanylyltransferase
MIKEAIILAGGKGTRLKSVVKDVPKPMADISGKPFLYYLIEKLIKQKVNRFIISVGYKADVIIDYFGNDFSGCSIVYANEATALGTGGALKYALSFTTTNDVIVLNGDTFFDIDFQKLEYIFNNQRPVFGFALRNMYNDNRYGGVELNEDLRIINYIEKDFIGDVYINAGIYLVDRSKFLSLTDVLPQVFSLEEDFFKEKYKEIELIGIPYIDAYFIDIGIPDDYHKGFIEIPKVFEYVENTFNTLFLDRDGVINKKIENGYVLEWEKFIFTNGFLDNINQLSKNFKRILVITNQRCVCKGLITEDALFQIHHKMSKEILKKGVKIEKIYICCEVEDTDFRRKPNIGMFLDAKNDYTDITFDRNSFMIGDSITDLIPAKNIGLSTILIKPHSVKLSEVELSDYIYNNLSEIKTPFLQ